MATEVVSNTESAEQFGIRITESGGVGAADGDILVYAAFVCIHQHSKNVF